MNESHLFQGKRIDNGEWVTGYYIGETFPLSGDEICDLNGIWHDVNPDTISQCTGLRDKNGMLMFKGSRTRLSLPNGEIREFEVDIRTAIRDVVSHPDFDDETARVAITGVVFLWHGYELFPCVDGDGIADTSKMEIIGTIYDDIEPLSVSESDTEGDA